MQLDATTLLQPSRRGDRARQLLAYGMGDVVAGDNHGDDRSIATLRDALVADGAGDAADILTRVNPGNVLQGKRLMRRAALQPQAVDRQPPAAAARE